jgi:pilus assembly protein CpaC
MISRLSLLLLILICFGAGAMPARANDAPVLSISVDRGIPITLTSPATSVFIANPEVADVQVMSPTSLMVFGKKTGETTLMATDATGHALLQRTVVVSQDLADLRRELAAAIPGNKITAEGVPGGIILTGEAHDPSSVEDARKIAARYLGSDGQVINRVQVVGSNQIMLRVRFAEVSRNVDKSFGINWGTLTNAGGFVFGIASGASLSALSGIGSLSTLNGERPSNATLAEPNDALAFSHSGGRLNVNGLIDALAQDGLITMLAEPNLTAMSGETAYFLAGGEVPIPIPQANGTISIEYKDYGVSLEFTPTLVSENRINLHVKPEVSQLTTIGAVTLSEVTAPAFLTRKAETTVELASGQSFAIAGLLDNNQDQTVNKFPFLGDIPILGPLFRSTEFQNGQSELVVIVTPYIVKPGMNEQQMALPTDGYSPPSESERLLEMRTSSGDPDARPLSGQPLVKRVTPVPAAPGTAPSAPVTSAPITTSPNAAMDATPMMMPGDAAMTAPATTPVAAMPVAPPPVAAAPASMPVSTPSPAASNISSHHSESAPLPVSPAAPAMPAPTNPGPAGPGGFLLE